MWIQTYLGNKVFPLNIKAVQIDIKDIAHALSLICRFNGHTENFYSVAEHSVRCYQIAKDGGYCRSIQYACLMHDTPEAYLSDISGPLKNLFFIKANVNQEMCSSFSLWEDKVLQVILKKYKFFKSIEEDVHTGYFKEVIKGIDYKMLVTEGRDLLKGGCSKWGKAVVNKYEPYPKVIKPWSPKKAEREFLKAFDSFKLDSANEINQINWKNSKKIKKEDLDLIVAHYAEDRKKLLNDPKF